MRYGAAWQSFFVLVFVSYMLVWNLLPTNTKYSWTPKLKEKLNSTYFREQGVNLLLFSFPPMLVAAMGCVYLHLKKTKSDSKSRKRLYLSLKRPAMVAAPLGIVNAVELTFVAMFVVLMIWSLANYLHVSFGHLHMHTPGVKVDTF